MGWDRRVRVGGVSCSRWKDQDIVNCGVLDSSMYTRNFFFPLHWFIWTYTRV